MKNYRITVNGTSYDVTVEELSGGAAPAAAPVAAPVAAPAPAAAPAPSRQHQQVEPEVSRFHHLCQVRSLQLRLMSAIQ